MKNKYINMDNKLKSPKEIEDNFKNAKLIRTLSVSSLEKRVRLRKDKDHGIKEPS